MRAGCSIRRILDTSENGWDALYRANLRHVLYARSGWLAAAVERGLPGSVINVTSIEGVRAAPGYAAYAAAKAGVINYTKTAALELAPHDIRINAFAPDITLTEGMMQVAPPGSTERVRLYRSDGPGRPRRRDGARRCVSRVRDGELHHRPDHSCRRWDERRRRLVPPSGDR